MGIRIRTQLVICVSSLILALGPFQAAAQSTRSGVTLAKIQRPPSLDLSRWTSPDASPKMAVPPQPQTTVPSDKRTPLRRFLGAAVGATAGFFVGGYTGAWIEGDRCHCDDPGLMGAVIGAPIGAVAGGILGGFFLF